MTPMRRFGEPWRVLQANGRTVSVDGPPEAGPPSLGLPGNQCAALYLRLQELGKGKPAARRHGVFIVGEEIVMAERAAAAGRLKVTHPAGTITVPAVDRGRRRMTDEVKQQHDKCAVEQQTEEGCESVVERRVGAEGEVACALAGASELSQQRH